MPAARALAAVLVAFVSGAILATEPFVSTIAFQVSGVSFETLEWIQVAVRAAIVVVHPVGTAAVGFVWGRAGDVPSEAVPLGAGTAIAAAVGAAATAAVVGVVVLGSGGSTSPGRLTLGLGTVVVRTALSVPVAVIAGAALAHFSKSERKRAPARSSP